MQKKLEKLIAAIEKQGCLLVFPIQNQALPRSLWSELHPRKEMIWEWGEEGQSQVGELWRLREQLASSHKVVYTKWFKNRATFFSKEVFLNLLAFLESDKQVEDLSRSSKEALDSFLLDSPQSTKLIKENLGWQGKLMESHFNRAFRPLWENLHIVAVGEVDDSSFPSLNIAASATIFEELWLEAKKISVEKSQNFLEKKWGAENLFYLQALKTRKKYRGT